MGDYVRLLSARACGTVKPGNRLAEVKTLTKSIEMFLISWIKTRACVEAGTYLSVLNNSACHKLSTGMVCLGGAYFMPLPLTHPMCRLYSSSSSSSILFKRFMEIEERMKTKSDYY